MTTPSSASSQSSAHARLYVRQSIFFPSIAMLVIAFSTVLLISHLAIIPHMIDTRINRQMNRHIHFEHATDDSNTQTNNAVLLCNVQDECPTLLLDTDDELSCNTPICLNIYNQNSEMYQPVCLLAPGDQGGQTNIATRCSENGGTCTPSGVCLSGEGVSESLLTLCSSEDNCPTPSSECFSYTCIQSQEEFSEKRCVYGVKDGPCTLYDGGEGMCTHGVCTLDGGGEGM